MFSNTTEQTHKWPYWNTCTLTPIHGCGSDGRAVAQAHFLSLIQWSHALLLLHLSLGLSLSPCSISHYTSALEAVLHYIHMDLIMPQCHDLVYLLYNTLQRWLGWCSMMHSGFAPMRVASFLNCVEHVLLENGWHSNLNPKKVFSFENLHRTRTIKTEFSDLMTKYL